MGCHPAPFCITPVSARFYCPGNDSPNERDAAYLTYVRVRARDRECEEENVDPENSVTH